MDYSTTKRCSKCGETKPLTEFHRNASQPDGHQNYCKVCLLAVFKQRNAKLNRRPRKWKTPLQPGNNKTCNVCKIIKPVEQFRKENRNYGDGYYNQCHECERAKGREWSKNRKEYARNWRRANRDRCYALARIWRDRNRDKYDAQRRRYYSSHRGRLYNRNSQAIRRSKSKQGDVTTAWLDQFLASQTKCFYCKKPFNSKRTKTIDHVIPLAKGGEHVMSNLVVACPSCNCSKHDKIVLLL